MEDNLTYIKEWFISLQGEGPYTGYKQLFIRFCKCNLSCDYCDTHFKTNENTKKYTPSQLISELKKINTQNIHSVSLTGGEPLIETKFLKELLPLIDKKIYLETNGTLPDKLAEIINFVDYISMDLKLNSATKTKINYNDCKKFIKIAKNNNKEIFLKVVLDNSITDEEIKTCLNLAKPYNLEIILQPVMIKDKMQITTTKLLAIFDKFNNEYEKVRLIPQIHKFLNIE